MSYMFLSYIGGFIFWVVFKLCKTSYNDEISNKNIERNILFLLVTILIIAFLTIIIF